MSEDDIDFVDWLSSQRDDKGYVGYVARKVAEDATLASGLHDAFHQYMMYHAHYWAPKKK